jgi:hypothetical protein
MNDLIGTLEGRLRMPRMTHVEFEAQVAAMVIRIRPFEGMWAREYGIEPPKIAVEGAEVCGDSLVIPRRFSSPDADPLFMPEATYSSRHLLGALAFVQKEAGSGVERGAEANSLLARAVAAGVLRRLDEDDFRVAIARGRLGQNVGRNEHDVFLDSVSGRVFKLTRDDGLSPRQGLLGYLERLGESNRLWADDFRLEGVFVDVVAGATRLMVSQPLIKGRAATPAEIATYMRAKGYKQYSDCGWWNEGSELLISDAEPVNVLMGCDGMVYPIDVIPAHPPASRVEIYNQVVASREAMG